MKKLLKFLYLGSLKIAKKLLKIFCLIIFICTLYEVIRIIVQVNETILPSVNSIRISFIENWKILFYNLSYTLLETVLGLLLVIIFATILAVFINEYQVIKKYLLKLIYIIQMIPLIAIAPLILIWLGYGITSKLILIVFYCSFVIIINLVESFENISISHKLYLQTLTTNKFKLYKYLYFPLAYEQFFAGIKVATTYGLVCGITSEYLGAKYGIGVLLNRAYASYQTDLVFSILIIIVIVTFIMLKIVDLLQRKIRS
ncbi:MAG: ABC transporter permease [Mycoplasmatales bacterium]